MPRWRFPSLLSSQQCLKTTLATLLGIGIARFSERLDTTGWHDWVPDGQGAIVPIACRASFSPWWLRTIKFPAPGDAPRR